MKIDLKELEALARAAEADGQHIYTNPRDSNKWRANENFIAAANPAAVLELIALARTPAAPPVTPKYIEEIKDILLWPVTEDDARVARDMLQSVQFDLSIQEAAPQQHPQAEQPKCFTCSGHGLIGGLTPGDGGYHTEDCPDCGGTGNAQVGLSDEQIEAIYLANGFTIKEGHAGLKAYVFRAARAIISASKSAPVAAAVQGDMLSLRDGEDIGCMREQSAAWHAVFAALTEVCPSWHNSEVPTTGIERAVTAIKALAQRAASAEAKPFYFGIGDEQAAIKAAEALGMIGVPLNEAGAINLAHGFMKLRKTDSERDAVMAKLRAELELAENAMVAMSDSLGAMAVQQGEKGGIS